MAQRTLLIGDNPFHGVSHFSQERARSRDTRINDPKWAAELVKISFENGANGFMFSVSETTLSILKMIPKQTEECKYYAIVPAAADYVRLSSQVGTTGLVTYVAKQTLKSGNIAAIANGIRGVLAPDMTALMRAYLAYEISRIKNVLGRDGKIYSLILHELITEMAVAMNMEWLIRAHVEYMTKLGIKPGFETRNFVCLVNKLKELKIDTSNIVITAPFNARGFQMNPNKADCEKALRMVPEAEVIAMSILASGYLKLPEAIDYINTMPELSGIVVGVSKEKHASDFRILKKTLLIKEEA